MIIPAVEFFPLPGSTPVHPVCLLQKADDRDKLPLIAGLLYFPVAKEVAGGHNILNTGSQSADICEVIGRGEAKLRKGA